MVIKIAEELEKIKNDFKEQEAKHRNHKIHQTFSTTSLYPWPVLLCNLLCIIGLIIYWFLNQHVSSALVVAIFLFLLMIFNIFFVFWCESKIRNHFVTKLDSLIQSIKDLNYGDDLNELVQDFLNFLESCDSTSFIDGPSHSFSYLYMNEYNDPVSVPTSLLSTGDVVGISSGEKAVCRLKCEKDGCVTFNSGDVVYKDLVLCQEHSLEMESCLLIKFVVMESPITEAIKTITKMYSSKSKYPLSPPSKMLSQSRLQYLRFTVFYILPIVVVVCVTSSVMWELFSSKTSQLLNIDNITYNVILLLRNNENFAWLQDMLLHIVLILVSTLHVSCPVLWIIPYVISETKTTATKKMETLLSIIQEITGGKTDIFCYDIVIFDALGSVTVLCCLNKEGILSWYEPAPEKVFFFNKAKRESPFQDSMNDLEGGETVTKVMKENKTEVERPNVEILTLSQDSQNSDRLQFDELNWVQHISSLKAICLNILVTNPNFKIDEELMLSKFSNTNEKLFCKELLNDLHQLNEDKDGIFKPKIFIENTFSQHRMHLNHLAVENDFQKPGGIKLQRGLLKLTELVGFSPEVALLHLPKSLRTIYKNRDQTTDCFKLHDPLSYAHHFVTQKANVLKGNQYCFTSGSCDLVLNLCTKYWNGSETQNLTEDLRKKALDFYQRSAVTGDCVAFAVCDSSRKDLDQKSCIEKFCDQGNTENEQVFLGMVALQYQSRIHIFHLIEALERSLIRFVHFSVDNEFRSRVFAEKMGLEAGWNCHISLSPSKLKNSKQPNSSNSINESHIEEGPSEPLIRTMPNTPGSESTISENAFHMRNRAKLPRGVDNIIPHIEEVDNVPLLVQLFTDCNQESSCKMIEIMQKYGEKVCCIGSSDSFQNIPVFSKSNVSIAIQPVLHSQPSTTTIPKQFSFHSRIKLDSTSQMSFCTKYDSTTELCDHKIMECARKLNTFPCHLMLSGDNSLNHIYNLIKKARGMLTLTHSSFNFLLQCLTIVTITQLLAHLTNLTLMFAAGDVFWVCLIVIPLLSVSILGSTKFNDEALPFTTHNLACKTKTIKIFKKIILVGVTRCLPTSVILLVIYILSVQSSCFSIPNSIPSKLSKNETSSIIKCFPDFTILISNTTADGPGVLSQSLFALKIRESQQLCTSALILYLSVISLSHVYRQNLLIKQLPFTNKTWIFAVIIIFFLQIVYTTLVLATYDKSDFENISIPKTWQFEKHKVAIWLIMFLWILPCIFINEILKWKEICNLTRSQKRARLAFETKLGMNSPF